MCPSGVPAALPELTTRTASSTHPSQMYTPGPAISLRALRCGLPQNVQASSVSGTGPRPPGAAPPCAALAGVTYGHP